MSAPILPGAEAPAVTIAQALRDALAAGVDRLDAQLLLSHALGQPRSWLVAHDDRPLAVAEREAVRAGVARRAAGEPLAYIVGNKEFHGLALAVDARVLVPRPDTEVLVDWAIELLGTELAAVAAPQVIDLGTGSGAIALAVKRARPEVRMLATDWSEAALAVAGRNAMELGLPVDFSRHAWWAGLDDRRFDLVLSNPPYIAEGDAHLPALRHEPLAALTSGPDGLDALREIVASAPGHLVPGGWLLLEHGHDQADAVCALLLRQGFERVATRRDLGDQTRCSGGRRR